MKFNEFQKACESNGFTAKNGTFTRSSKNTIPLSFTWRTESPNSDEVVFINWMLDSFYVNRGREVTGRSVNIEAAIANEKRLYALNKLMDKS
jgi:hypothetical protein